MNPKYLHYYLILILLLFFIPTIHYAQNYSLNFQGNAYINLPIQLVNNPNEFTIEAWVKPSQQSTENGMVFYHGQGGEIDFVVGNDFTVYFDIKMIDGTFHGVSSTKKLIQGQWAHIAGVYKRSEQKLKIFINGTLDVTLATPNIDLFSPSGLTSRIGAYGGVLVRKYIGSIDEVRFSNIARYSSNFFPITNFFNDANTVGLWKFNEGTGSIVYDASTNRYNGNLIGATYSSDYPVYPLNGLVAYYPFNGNANDESGNSLNGVVSGASLTTDRFGTPSRAYYFNGINNYIQLPYDLQIQNGNVFTFTCWFNSGGASTSGIFLGSGSGNNHIDLGYYSTPQKKLWIDCTNNSISDLWGSTTLVDNTIYFATFVINGTSVKFYLNGQYDGSGVLLNQANPSSNARLGSRDDNWNIYGGILDDIRIYSRILSDAEILALYHENGWQQFTINTSAYPANGGTTTGGGVYDYGSTILIVANPNSGYKFVSWTENGNVVSTNSSYSFTITNNRNLVANFSPTTFTITTSSNPSLAGNTSGGGVYNINTNVTVIATPNTGYMFVNWTESGNIVATTPSYQFNVTSNRILVANYSTIPTLTVSPLYIGVNSSSGNGSFTVANTTGGTMNWSAISNSNWINIVSGSSGTNNGTINISYQTNNGGYRVGTITVTSTGAFGSPQSVEVRQSQIVNVEDQELIPIKFMLYQNYPNPFNPTTIISYDLPSSEYVMLKIYDLLGREIMTPVHEYKTAGRYNITLNAKDIPSGILIYKIDAGNYHSSRKLILLK